MTIVLVIVFMSHESRLQVSLTGALKKYAVSGRFKKYGISSWHGGTKKGNQCFLL